MEKVTIIAKPRASKERLIGKIISQMESNGLELTDTVPKISLKRRDIKELYDLIGVELTDAEEVEWCMLEHTTTDPVFSFVFSGIGAHEKIDNMKLHKEYPVIYVKRGC